MDKKVIIGIAVGVSLIAIVAGVVIYKRVSSTNDAAKRFLGDGETPTTGGKALGIATSTKPIKVANHKAMSLVNVNSQTSRSAEVI